MLVTDSENGDVYQVEIKGGLMTRKFVRPGKPFRIDSLKNLRAAGLGDQCMTWVFDQLPAPTELTPAIAVPADIESLQQVEDLLNTAYGLVPLHTLKQGDSFMLPGGRERLNLVANKVYEDKQGFMLARYDNSLGCHYIDPMALVRPLK